MFQWHFEELMLLIITEFPKDDLFFSQCPLAQHHPVLKSIDEKIITFLPYLRAEAEGVCWKVDGESRFNSCDS